MDGREVVITGLGVISAAGVGWAEVAAAQAVAPRAVEGFDASGFPAWAQVAYQVPSLRPQPYMKRRKDLKVMSRDAQLALVAAGLAVEDAGLDPREPGAWPFAAEDVALYMGVGLEPGDVTELGPAAAAARGADGRIDLEALGSVGIDRIPPLSALVTLPNMALAHVSINLELMGRGEALSPWGTAGLDAVAAAAESVARGQCDVALAGAADGDVDLSGVSRALRLGITGEGGAVLGEGGAFFVLEARQHAEARGQRWLARLARHVAHAAPTRQLGVFDAGLVGSVAEAALAGLAPGSPVAVVGASSGHPGWAAQERAALEDVLERRGGGAVEQRGGRVGWAGAASGLLELADALASRRASGGRESLVGLAWAPTGQASALVLDRVGEGGR